MVAWIITSRGVWHQHPRSSFLLYVLEWSRRADLVHRGDGLLWRIVGGRLGLWPVARYQMERFCEVMDSVIDGWVHDHDNRWLFKQSEQ